MKRLPRSATFNVHFVTQVSGPDSFKFGSPSEIRNYDTQVNAHEINLRFSMNACRIGPQGRIDRRDSWSSRVAARLSRQEFDSQLGSWIRVCIPETDSRRATSTYLPELPAFVPRWDRPAQVFTCFTRLPLPWHWGQCPVPAQLEHCPPLLVPLHVVQSPVPWQTSHLIVVSLIAFSRITSIRS